MSVSSYKKEALPIIWAILIGLGTLLLGLSLLFNSIESIDTRNLAILASIASFILSALVPTYILGARLLKGKDDEKY